MEATEIYRLAVLLSAILGTVMVSTNSSVRKNTWTVPLLPFLVSLTVLWRDATGVDMHVLFSRQNVAKKSWVSTSSKAGNRKSWSAVTEIDPSLFLITSQASSLYLLVLFKLHGLYTAGLWRERPYLKAGLFYIFMFHYDIFQLQVGKHAEMITAY